MTRRAREELVVRPQQRRAFAAFVAKYWNATRRIDEQRRTIF